MNLHALVAPLRADVVSGATAVARAASGVVRRVAHEGEAEGIGELRDLLVELALRILEAQPAMAPLVHLCASVLTAVEDLDAVDAARERAARAAADFDRRLEEARTALARRAATLLPSDGPVVTISHSSAVRRTLLEAAGAGGEIEVVCLESRPLSEGRRLAGRLAEAGLSVTYAVDAAAWHFASGAAAVLFGADSVGDRGVANKVGSRSLAAAGRSAGVPVYVLADRTKLLPPGFPQPVDDDRPEDEVWRSPAGIRVWNRYFECVPLDVVDAVVTEEGTLGAGAVAEARSAIPVPDELERWARERGR